MLAVFGDRLVNHPLAEKGHAQAVAARKAIGPKPDGRAVFGDRLPHLPLGLQGLAQMEVGMGEGRLKLDRRAEFGDDDRRVGRAARVSKGEAEVG